MEAVGEKARKMLRKDIKASQDIYGIIMDEGYLDVSLEDSERVIFSKL